MRRLKQLWLYYKLARSFTGSKAGCSVRKLVTFFPAWDRSLCGGATPLKDQQPWMTFAAIEFLRCNLDRSMRVFEYGAGGSTMFFAEHTGEVVSIEHNPEWCEAVKKILAQQGRSNARVELIKPEPDQNWKSKDPGDPAAFISAAPLYRGMQFWKYVTQIDSWPNGHFHLVVVDGRSRPACLVHAAPKVAPGGWLVLDNAEREYYHPAAALFQEPTWRKTDFSGPGPYNPFFWRTWIWQKISGQSETFS